MPIKIVNLDKKFETKHFFTDVSVGDFFVFKSSPYILRLKSNFTSFNTPDTEHDNKTVTCYSEVIPVNVKIEWTTGELPNDR